MNDVIQQINLYNNLFKVCLVLSLVFLVVAVTIFFMLDIKSTIGYLTGRKAKKQIKELEAANAESGRLMSKGKSMQYLDQKMKSDMGVRQAATLGIRKVEHAVEHVVEPAEQQVTAQQQMVQQSTTKKFLGKRKNEPESQDSGILTTSDTDATQLLYDNPNGGWDMNNTTVLSGEMYMPPKYPLPRRLLQPPTTNCIVCQNSLLSMHYQKSYTRETTRPWQTDPTSLPLS